MGKITGFLEYDRVDESVRTVNDRLKDYDEFTVPLSQPEMQSQAARCMDCGIPFCHSGCPLGNLIPDFNDLVYQGKWEEAAEILHATNNFPEFTGRLCPAPCEEACVLGINEDPVSIENIEKNIVETAFQKGWIKAQPPRDRTGKKVAIVGSGPAGLAAAQQLNRVGHEVTIFERDDKIGGLLRYGIPDFKLEKKIIDRRLKIMEEEGVIFKVNTNIGVDLEAKVLASEFDAVLLCGGATAKRELPIPGSELKGIYQAMDYLKQSNQRVAGQQEFDKQILANGKNVIVIGGGDTGSDCIGTSHRQGAKNVINFEIMEKPSHTRPVHQPWPYWPMKYRESSSHKEGGERVFGIATKEFVGDGKGHLSGLKTINVQWKIEEGKRPELIEIPGTEKLWECERVFLALGFTGAEKTLPEQFGVEMDYRSNVKAGVSDYKTNVPGVFAAGDIRRGQSLIVWAISEGRQAAHHVDIFLSGSSELPVKGPNDLPRI